MEKLNENIKNSVRSWLNILPASPYNFQINETLDFEGNAIRNRIWYRGDGNELEQIYQQNRELVDKITSGLANQLREWICGKSTRGCRG